MCEIWGSCVCINACERGSRVFAPGPGGGCAGFPRDRVRAPPEMAVCGGEEGGDQAASGFGVGGIS